MATGPVEEERGAWNPRGIAFVAMLSVFPAAVLHALNYKRLGRPDLLRPTLVRNLVVALLAYAVVPFVGLAGTELCVLWIALLHIAGAVYCQNSQFVLFMKHVGRGGKEASVAAPAFGLFVLFGVAFVLLMMAARTLD